MELYFVPPDNISGSILVFDDFEAQHILRSMRKKKGDAFHVTDGQGHLYRAKLTEFKPKLRATATMEKSIAAAPLLRTLAVGFIKPARLDYLIEKCTELGIGKFILINSVNANYSTDNITRLIKISRQAIKQSQRLFLPEITVCNSFELFLQTVESCENKFIAEQGDHPSIREIRIKSSDEEQSEAIFAIGPEGGFSPQEIEDAVLSGFTSVDFNTHRLRAETASVFAAVCMNLWT